MKHIATVALMLHLGVAGVYAQQKPVTLTFSGTAAPSTINLQQPNTLPANRISPGTVPWARSRFELSGLRQVLRNRPALARAFIFQVWPAREYFASKMGVY
jgi:hypothetical protein